MFPQQIDLGWYRRVGYTSRLVWDSTTDVLYVVRYVAGSMNSTVAFEMPLGGCDLEDLPDISAAWAERGPDYLRALSSYVHPVARKVDPPGASTVE